MLRSFLRLSRAVQIAAVSVLFVTGTAGVYFMTGDNITASVTSGGKTYHLVSGTNAGMDSGNEVCASMGQRCVGYTSLGTNAVCKLFHPNAKELVSLNGSKSGFYCNGAPQKGAACEKTKDTCQVCPTCNVNADCAWSVGSQYREMYVECAPLLSQGMYGPLVLPHAAAPVSIRPAARSSRPKSSVRSSAPRSSARSSARASAPRSAVPSTPQPGGFWPLASGGSIGAPRVAGDRCMNGTQCQSGFCTIPDRRESFTRRCTCSNSTYTTAGCTALPRNVAAQKNAGELCQIDGECFTGNCLPVMDGYGLKRCSCDPARHDTRCN